MQVNRLKRILPTFVPTVLARVGAAPESSLTFTGRTFRSLTSSPLSSPVNIRVNVNEIKNISIERLLGAGGEARVDAGKLFLDLPVTSELSGKEVEVAFRTSLASTRGISPTRQFLGKWFGQIDQMNREESRLVSETEYKKLKSEIDLVESLSSNNRYIVKYLVTEPMTSSEGEVRGVVEMCQGSIDKTLKKEMDFSKMLNFLGDASEGVAGMHAQGYIHSDIKPENIFISRDGSTGLVGDFGTTTKVGERSKGGSLHYMRNKTDSEFNTEDKDLYALALTAKDLLNLSEFIDTSNPPAQIALMNEINQFIEKQLHKETQIPAKEFAQKMREFSKKAEEIGFSPLGEKNLNAALLQIQNIRAGLAAGVFLG